MYIACEKDQEESIHFFGEGDSIEAAIKDLSSELQHIAEDRCVGDQISIGVYEAIQKDQMNADELSVAECEGWSWILGELVKELEYTVLHDKEVTDNII